MAKRQSAPAVETAPIDLPPDLPLAREVPTPTAAAAPAKPVIEEAQVTVPIDHRELPSEFPVHIDTTLSLGQSTALRRMSLALVEQQAKLGNGTRVTNVTLALKYLLEHIAPTKP